MSAYRAYTVNEGIEPSGSPPLRATGSAGLYPPARFVLATNVRYQLPQTSSVFQFNSCKRVSVSRYSLDRLSTSFCSAATETVATNLTSDFE